jgi:hypothetical protein
LEQLSLYLAAQRPAWLNIQRVFGECGIPQDTPEGRKEFERRLELLRAGDGSMDLDAIRRDWCVGDDEFRSQLLAQVNSKSGVYHYGHELHQAAEEKAERVIREELERLGWSETELRARRKGDPAKLEIALRVRRETTMTLHWVASRLCMGTKTYLAHLLYWEQRKKPEPAPARRAQVESKPRHRSEGRTTTNPRVRQSAPSCHYWTDPGFDTSFD